MESITITDTTGTLVSFAGAPVRAVRYEPRTGDSGLVHETIAVTLEGTPAAINAWILNTESVLHAAAAHARDPVGMPFYLRVEPVDGEGTWQSKVLDGTLERHPGHDQAPPTQGTRGRQRGATQVRLQLTRPDWWELGESTSLLNAATVTQGDTNTLTIDGGNISGSLPAPLSLQVKNLAANAVGDLWLGIDARFDGGQINQFEMEDMGSLGSGVSVVSDVSLSGDAGLAVSAAAGSEFQVGSYSLSAGDQTGGYNRSYRLLGLVRSPSSGLYGYFKVTHNSVDLVVGEAVPFADGIVDLGILRLPPWLYDLAAPFEPETIDLEVWLYQESGTMTVTLDAIHALPLDGGFTLFADLGGGLPQDRTLHREGERCFTTRTSGVGDTFWLSHQLRGGELHVYPGGSARLHVIWERNGGGFDARDSLQISAAYQLRVRSL